MILLQNICKSSKRVGMYEEQIIDTLIRYFSESGYEVLPHSSLNIAWGSVLSDIDLLLLKEQSLTYVEVKSSRDNISRARQQINRIMDYIDYAYVATDKRVTNFDMDKVGLITVHDETVRVLKKAARFSNKPSFYSVITLKKKCLSRFLGMDTRNLGLVSKYDLAQNVYTKNNRACTRNILKEIVTCGDLCSSGCPIEMQRESSFIPQGL